MKKIDFSQIKILDVTDKEIDMGDQKLHESIGDIVYREATTISLAELAKRIYRGEEVELRDSEIEEIKQIIEKSIIPLVRRQVLEYINNL